MEIGRLRQIDLYNDFISFPDFCKESGTLLEIYYVPPMLKMSTQCMLVVPALLHVSM